MTNASKQKIDSSPLSTTITAICGSARSCLLKLPHGKVQTPVFMPVGTHGCLKGLTSQQVESLEMDIILANTYHLWNKPGCSVLKDNGGLHPYCGWKKCLLTDSGGFQMVSLSKLGMEVTEDGVTFVNPYDKTEMTMTPEMSINAQNEIGADIIMALDDVISSTVTDDSRIEEATHRTLRWLKRCVHAHKRPHDQCLFPIIQASGC
eukprot:Filipodium_phascolosomae@DN2580_c0_g1_i2.p1